MFVLKIGKATFALLLFLLVPMLLAGQISGRVRSHEGQPIELARIALLSQRDSSLRAETYTGKDGSYSLEQLEAGSYLLSAASMGAVGVVKKVMLFRGKPLKVDFQLLDEGVQLKEVEVRSTGITVRGDTTRYRAAHFATGDEQNLKELMERLPEVRVAKDGSSVQVKGKAIGRILLEGNDLYQGNVSTPLKHLNAESVKDIEVIEGYSQYDIYRGFHSSNETVLNLNLKEGAKQKPSGDLSLMAGYKKRYKLHGTALYLGRHTMLSAILSSLNTGDRQLHFSDIISMSGGYNNILSSRDPLAAIEELRESYQGFMMEGQDLEKRLSHLLSLNLIHTPSKKLKIQLNGILSHSRLEAMSEQYYSYPSLSYQEATREKSQRTQLLLKGGVSYTPTEAWQIRYEVSLLSLGQHKQFASMLYGLDASYRRKPRLLHFEERLHLSHKLDEKTNLGLSLIHKEQEEQGQLLFDSSESFYSLVLQLGQSYLYGTRERKSSLELDLFLLRRLSDTYFLRIGYNPSWSREGSRAALEGEGATERYRYSRQLSPSISALDLRLSKDQGKLQYSLGSRLEYLSIKGFSPQELPRYSKLHLAPYLDLKYQLSMRQNLMLSYSYGMERYPLSALIDAPRILSYNSFAVGAAESLYRPHHRAKLIHVLSMPLSGFSLTTLLDLYRYDESLLSDLSILGRARLYQRQSGTKEERAMLGSFAEYRFLSFPSTYA